MVTGILTGNLEHGAGGRGVWLDEKRRGPINEKVQKQKKQQSITDISMYLSETHLSTNNTGRATQPWVSSQFSVSSSSGQQLGQQESCRQASRLLGQPIKPPASLQLLYQSTQDRTPGRPTGQGLVADQTKEGFMLPFPHAN